jgi:hypothetical protein
MLAQRSEFLFEITNHPVCAAEERDLFVDGAATQETAPVTPLYSVGIKLAPFLFAFGLDAGQLILFENGGEWTRLVTNPFPLCPASQPVGQFCSDKEFSNS